MGSRCLSVGWAVLSLWLGPDAQIPDSRGERFAGEALLPPPHLEPQDNPLFLQKGQPAPPEHGWEPLHSQLCQPAATPLWPPP